MRLKGCGYRTVLYDYPTRRRSMQDNAQSLAGFVAGLGAGRVHLVGHSMGGTIVALLAIGAFLSFLMAARSPDPVEQPIH